MKDANESWGRLPNYEQYGLTAQSVPMSWAEYIPSHNQIAPRQP